jgi:hypothetical protein
VGLFVCSRTDQQPVLCDIVEIRRHLQCCRPVRLGDIHRGRLRQQDADRCGVPTPDGRHERRSDARGCHIDMNRWEQRDQHPSGNSFHLHG